MFLLIIVFSAIPNISTAADLTRDLKYGDRGPDVLLLQKMLNESPDTQIASSGPGSPGQETDFFGSLTVQAVKRFQIKYRAEVLYPVNIFAATGYVGSMTRAKLADLSKPAEVKSEHILPVSAGGTSQTAAVASKVKVFSVSPNTARAGEEITIYGEGFTPKGNTVVLQYGTIEQIFSGLTSADGEKITFRYYPPQVKNMTEMQVRALPYDMVTQIETPVKKSGSTLGEVLDPYKDMKNVSELEVFLAKQGKKMDDLYDFYYITVRNSEGVGASEIALLWGERYLPMGSSLTEKAGSLLARVKELIGPIAPEAVAQLGGGGYHTGIIMYCTCGGGHLIFAISMGAGYSGLIWMPPGFVPFPGTGFVASQWLGFVTPGAGICSIISGPTCITINGGMPVPAMWASLL